MISTRTVTTEDVDGSKALVRDKADLTAADDSQIPAGTRLTGFDDYYTIDRKTMEAIDNFTANDAVLPREGLVVGFPIDTEARDYQGWNGDPQTPVTLVFVGEEEREGINTYVFTASEGPLPILDPGTLGEFPAGLPKETVPAIAPLLNLPPELEALIGQALPLLPDVLPLEYTYEFSARYWIDPTTGILIDIEKNDVRKAIVAVPGLPLEVPPIEVYNLNYTPTAESKADAVDDAKSNGRLLQLGRTTGPIALWILGALLLVGGAYLLLRRPTERAPVIEPHHVGEPDSGGEEG